MSYTALYRKFRPGEFEDVKGQDHISKTLQNQIKADRIGHAYLFCGTRGTGKTSVAKIFAKAVNCEHPVNGSPCGVCDSCKAISSGTSMLLRTMVLTISVRFGKRWRIVLRKENIKCISSTRCICFLLGRLMHF